MATHFDFHQLIQLFFIVILILFCFFLVLCACTGQHSDPRCVYVPPSTGKTFFAFRIAYARCGTKPDLNGQFYENTVSFIYMYCMRYTMCTTHEARIMSVYLNAMSAYIT